MVKYGFNGFRKNGKNHTKPTIIVYLLSMCVVSVVEDREIIVVVVVVVVSHIQRIGCQPEKLLYTVANPARGLLNREKRTKDKVWQHTPPPPPPPHCSFGENK